MLGEVPTVQSSRAEVWYLKEISFNKGPTKKNYRIITQNFNGPCSFIAICNILILREQIEILPPSRSSVSYEFLSQLVGEYLLRCSSDVDISAALSALPYTQRGLDLNPQFTSSTSFRPGAHGGELALFETAGIKLVHGWLVDPASPEAHVVTRIADYDTAVNIIADADHLTRGQLLVNDDHIPESPPASPITPLTQEEQRKVEDAIVLRRFLDSTWSQLTYHGLFNLAHTLEPDQLVALFRSSHLSVLYKSPGENSALYTLVTDQAFLHEPSVVWEQLEDVDGGWSSFVDSEFIRSSPAGGDVAGQTADDALRAAESLALSPFAPSDHALAIQLQAEEEERARREHAEYLRQEEQRRSMAQQPRNKQKMKRKPSCLIM